MNNRLSALHGLAIAVLISAPVWSEEHVQPEKKYSIEFTGIVDSIGGFSSFGNFPAINNHGEVTFTAVAGNGQACSECARGRKKSRPSHLPRTA